MAQIIVRNLPDEAKERLRIQAAECGVSLEAYVRDLLNKTAASASGQNIDIVKTFKHHFGKRRGVDLKLPSRHSTRSIPNFD